MYMQPSPLVTSPLDTSPLDPSPLDAQRDFLAKEMHDDEEAEPLNSSNDTDGVKSRSRRRRVLAAPEDAPKPSEDSPLYFTQSSSGELRPSRALNNKDAAKLAFFEKLFFTLDDGGEESLKHEEVKQALSFMAINMAPLEQYEVIHNSDTDGDGAIQRWEFVELCARCLWEYETDFLEHAAHNYLASKRQAVKVRKSRWRNLALTIDQHCRFWVLLAYTTALGLLSAVELDDPYGFDGLDSSPPPPATSQGCDNYNGSISYIGFCKATWTASKLATGLVAPAVVAAMGLGTLGGMMISRRYRYKTSHVGYLKRLSSKKRARIRAVLKTEGAKTAVTPSQLTRTAMERKPSPLNALYSSAA